MSNPNDLTQITFYMACLRLTGRPCLVIGAGPVLSYYEFKQPIRIPKGTKVQFEAHFNNTVRAGYLNPGSWVYWGDQTWEEMMGNWFGLLIDRKIDPNDVMKPIAPSSVLGGGEEG